MPQQQRLHAHGKTHVATNSNILVTHLLQSVCAQATRGSIVPGTFSSRLEILLSDLLYDTSCTSTDSVSEEQDATQTKVEIITTTSKFAYPRSIRTHLGTKL